MRFQLLDKTKKKKIIEKISYLGINKIPYLLLTTGKEKIRAFSGVFSNEELCEIRKILPIEGVGLYFGKQVGRPGQEEIRLSIDALHMLQKQITSNKVELSEEQTEKWFEGKDIELTKDDQELAEKNKTSGFVAVMFNKDIIGTGKISQDKKVIYNYLPKERRRKN